MKKLLLSTFALAVTFAASAFNLAPAESNVQLGTPMNAKQAPKEVVAKLAEKAIAARAPKKINAPVTVASDLLGGYSWTYEMSKEWDVDPTTVETTDSGTDDVLFYDANDEAGTFMIAGMFDGPISATLDLESYSYPTFTLGEEKAANSNSYGACYIKAVFYYEGDASTDGGWYYTDPLAFVFDDEIIWATDIWFFREIASGTYAGYYLTPLWKPGSEMVANPDVNAVMAYTYNINNKGDFDYVAVMSITQENYVATVNNFAGLADNPVTIHLEEGRTWTADATVLFSNNNGDYVLYGIEGNSLVDLTGTGTETTLTFDTDWTGYDTSTQYYLGERGAATITLVGEEFVWPGEDQPEPAMYLAGSMTDWATGKEAMTLENGVFTITKEMEANAEFKFINENDEWIGGDAEGNFIVQKEQVENGTELTLVLNGGNNFEIPVAGTWTLTVDPEDMTLVISGEWNEPVEETHLYILGNVGDQTTWDPSVGTEMQAAETENVFEYTGTFNDDSYFSFTKKLAETSGDWDAIKAYRVGATTDGFEVDNLLGENIALGEWGSSSDNAFKITNGGEYTVTVDLNDMVVVFTKTEIPLEGITLNYSDEDEVVLEANQTLQLVVNAVPEGATLPEISWSSSNEEVASVDENGLVTAYELPTKSGQPAGMRRVPTEEGYYFEPVIIEAASVDNADMTASVVIYVKGDVVDTAVNDLKVVVGNVTYVDVMGHTSNKPFKGVNIIMVNGKSIGKMMK